MLVLVSFVLVLAAAVTLVVGLLQSGLTLIYLSIACSVLAGVVLAVAVLRGRPEPKPAAAGRSFPSPAPSAQVPASVGASSSGAETTTSFNAPSYPSAPPPPPPPPPPSPAPSSSDDSAAKAAGTALLGRLRGKRDQDESGDGAPERVVPAPAPSAVDETSEMAVVPPPVESDDGFPIANYDQLRATDLLRQLSALDRNQLEAVRQRESSGKNRFTIMSRIDTLLAAKEEPAWEVADDEWEAEADTGTTVIEAGPAGESFDADEEVAFLSGEIEDDEADQVDMASAPAGFPIAGYETLTVGQILPRLSDLDADELAAVRAREQQGRARGTILDRIDRLASKSAPAAMAMPAAPPAKAARKAPTARKARVAKVAPEPAPPATAPMKEAVKKARAAKAAKAVTSPEAAPTVQKRAPRKAAAPVVPAPAETTPMKEAVKKAAAKKTTRKAAAPAAPVKKSRATKRP